ncbi:uracil-DNA glycosylase [Halorussus aquaticus]|uniref:Uracil-DNA glycosylase family protein n=1 Tax=Halorussus aquaticus TaxID=2953748 RepID=A0ABD5Q3C6_9EURY|nr:uracil-DNA glycosylase family protein [Halorussus aquaticus]
MDANQQTRSNPFGMDADCENCPELCATREQVVHGYGDVGADFLFVGEVPEEGADRTGVPFTGDERGEALQHVLGLLGLNNSLPSDDEPELDNAFVTYLARCHTPERAPTDEEIRTCEPYLNAEIRMINPEILVPVGQRALSEIATEYTTAPAEEFDAAEDHATTIRGRGFEIVPMADPLDQTDAEREAFLDHFSSLMDRDYRQTKGRRGR